MNQKIKDRKARITTKDIMMASRDLEQALYDKNADLRQRIKPLDAYCASGGKHAMV